MSRILLSAMLLAATALPVMAESVNVAVAANFTAVAEELAAKFEAESGHEVELSFGATGQLYTQITQAAPYGVFLAADTERPEKAIAEGLAVDGSFFVYAQGRLALYGEGVDADNGKAALKGDFAKIAIADPEAAPYGQAAVETLEALGLWETLEPKLVQGESISQTLQFIESGNAELGFVAASQVLGKDVWIVPAELHQPIEQGAVLLKAGEGNAAAEGLLQFLRSDAAVAVIEGAGYSVP
ncbi:molybdate ABC transporter substrate-binding protein [Devosia rhizoryzae]|uniref:Molybdate ABC transporter substrate-binding protein n=1 Tax=Devosia rhizoryzae TaxID=2774137 RepID=A0ABX7C5X2_9HYPH|nr:molybdate ABC transporter substrate-binding protein [Devosia rhizoryzae]QQR39501.1 molybdate ABC transporter substrate-binding protein [Devosia rhizoryzae]